MSAKKSRCGNTLRRPHSDCAQESRLYGKTNLVNFSVECIEPEKNFNVTHSKHGKTLDILNQRFSTNVSYSLNKQGRWNLPQDVKENFCSDTDLKSCRVTMSQYHMLNKPNNCLEIFTNDRSMAEQATLEDAVTRRARKSKCYFNANLALRSSSPSAENADDAASGQVNIDIYKPVDKTSKIIHDCKLMKTKSQHHSAWSRTRSHTKRIVYLPDADEDSVEEDFCLGRDDEYSSKAREPSMADYIVCRVVKSKSKKGKASNHDTNARAEGGGSRKKTLVFVDRHLTLPDDGKAEQETAMNAAIDYAMLDELPEFPWIRVKLAKCQFSARHLTQVFGQRVCFSNGQPVRAVIDMADNRSACFILEEDGELYEEDDFKLSLNSSIHSPDEGRDFLAQACALLEQHGCVSMLTQLFIFMDDAAAKMQDASSPSLSNCKAHYPVQLRGAWTMCKVVAESAAKSQILNGRQEASFSGLKKNEHEDELLLDDVGECGICLEPWAAAAVKWLDRATSLHCGHAFCNRCWSQHLQTAMATGVTDIRCPSHKCGLLVDKGTLLAFLPVRLHQRHESALFGRLFSVNGHHYCTAKQCGRLLRVPSSHLGRAGNVACPCSHLFCGRCRDEPHWPVSCQIAQKYKDKRQRLNHNRLEPQNMMHKILVQGKVCPSCQNFIEKASGCNHMTCLCGYDFCWVCLLAWEDCLCTSAHLPSVATEKHVLTSNDEVLRPGSQQSRAYCRAVEQRLRRLQFQSSPRHRTCATPYGRTRHESSNDLNAFDVVYLLNEMSYLTEYTWVAVDSFSSDRATQRTLKSIVEQFEFYMDYFTGICTHDPERVNLVAAGRRASTEVVDEWIAIICSAHRHVQLLTTIVNS